MGTSIVKGYCDKKYSRIQNTFESNFIDHGEIGASVCLYKDGEKVVDLWGGYSDKACTKPWQENTLVNVWSTTKGIMALCIARLNTQGILRNDRPVSDYWPEFGVQGKQDITVAELFSHQAGLCGLKDAISESVLLDTKISADLLAAEAPHWPPGTQCGYHAMSIGPLADGLVMRVTGKTLGEYFRDEIALPLNIDFHMGIMPKDELRVAEIIHDGKPINGGSDTFNTYQRIAFESMPMRPEIANEKAWQRQGMPSAGGIGNARSIAKLYGALATDRCIDGVELVSEKMLGAATDIQIESNDLVIGLPATWGIGFAMNKGLRCYGPNNDTFGHQGWGGSFGFADPDHNIGIAYTMNYMRETEGRLDPRFSGLVKALYASV